MLTWGDVKRWNGEPLSSAVGQLNREYNQLLSAGEDLRGINAPSGWSGPAASAARAKGVEIANGLEEWSAEIAAVRRGAGAVGDAIAGVKNGVHEAEGLARAQHFTISDDGSLVDHGPPPGTPREQEKQVADERRAIAEELRDRVAQVLRSAEDIDNDFCKVLDRALAEHTIDADQSTSLAAAGDAGAALGSLSIPTPPPGDASPAQNAAWWASLSERQRNRFARDYPAQVGPRNGISSKQRSMANRILLGEQRGKLESELDSLKKERSDLPRGPGSRGTLSQIDENIRVIEAKLSGLEDIQSKLDSNEGASENERYYLLDVSTDGDGTAVISKGNPDSAANVATFVPGTGSDISNIGDTMDRSDRMADRARMSGSDSTAVISWHGYDAPDSIPNATLKGYAEEAEPNLANFQEGLSESRNVDAPPRHNTLIGHSYGGTAVGMTAQNHDMPVDDMVLVGAPGVGSATADNLQVPEGHVWATADENDPVPDSYAHGRDATDPDFGARSFDSNSHTEGSPWQLGYNADSHSMYWDYNNPALKTMGDIIAGVRGS